MVGNKGQMPSIENAAFCKSSQETSAQMSAKRMHVARGYIDVNYFENASQFLLNKFKSVDHVDHCLLLLCNSSGY